MNKKDLKINEKSQNKKSTKSCSNHTSNLQPPNSNFSTLTSHFSSLTSDHKAITLIALVITIIVMLILVGVTVTVAINGGLFNTAKDAARKTQFEADRESLLSAVIGAINDNAEVNFEGLNENLPEGFTGNNEDGYTSKSGNTFFVDRDGNIDTVTIIEKEETTTDDYGKYVKYGVDLNGDGIYTNDWKVFYVDEQNRTFIIAADYVRGDGLEGGCQEVKQAIENSKMVESTESGYEDFCYYWDKNDVTGTEPQVTYHCNDNHSSLNSEKGQCSYPNIFMADDYYCSSHVGEDGKSGNPNSRCASTLLCSDNWSPLVSEDCKGKYGAQYAIGGPTLEMWVASWNQKHGETVDPTNGINLYANGNDNSTEKYGYNVEPPVSETDPWCSVKGCSAGYNDTLYFPHKTMSNLPLDEDKVEDDECCGYWLASPAAVGSGSVSDVYYNGSVSTGGYSYSRCSLRPVVCLGSQVKLASTEE